MNIVIALEKCNWLRLVIIDYGKNFHNNSSQYLLNYGTWSINVYIIKWYAKMEICTFYVEQIKHTFSVL